MHATLVATHIPSQFLARAIIAERPTSAALAP
jgi:hypothetical protein